MSLIISAIFTWIIGFVILFSIVYFATSLAIRRYFSNKENNTHNDEKKRI